MDVDLKLNMFEIELNILSRQCIDRHIPDQETLKKEITARQENRRDAHARPMKRQLATDNVRIKIEKNFTRH